MIDESLFERRVRVRSLLPSCATRVFLWCEQRPEACSVHGYRHQGDLWTTGHHLTESGVTGEIAGHLGGMNDGHEWIVRYDRILTIEWPCGALEEATLLLRVNSGTYTLDELEFL